MKKLWVAGFMLCTMSVPLAAQTVGTNGASVVTNVPAVTETASAGDRGGYLPEYAMSFQSGIFFGFGGEPILPLNFIYERSLNRDLSVSFLGGVGFSLDVYHYGYFFLDLSGRYYVHSVENRPLEGFWLSPHLGVMFEYAFEFGAGAGYKFVLGKDRSVFLEPWINYSFYTFDGFSAYSAGLNFGMLDLVPRYVITTNEDGTVRSRSVYNPSNVLVLRKHPFAISFQIKRLLDEFLFLGFHMNVEWSINHFWSLALSGGSYGLSFMTMGVPAYSIQNVELSSRFYLHSRTAIASQGFWLAPQAGVYFYDGAQFSVGGETGYKIVMGVKRDFFLEPFIGLIYFTDGGYNNMTFGINIGNYL